MLGARACVLSFVSVPVACFVTAVHRFVNIVTAHCVPCLIWYKGGVINKPKGITVDKDAIRFLAEIAARRRIGKSMNAKAEYNSGILRGNALYGDNGAPTPKSGRKAKLTLALPRGKADLEAQARRAARQADRLTGPFPWRVDAETRKQCEAMPKDVITSHNCPTSNPKVAKNMISRAWRPGDPDGSEPYALPGGNGMPVRKTIGKAAWTETPGYVFATERPALETAKPARPARSNRPKPAWKDASEIDFKVVRKRVFVLQKITVDLGKHLC